MMFMVPISILLGSVSLTAIARAFGSKEPVQLTHRAAAGVGGSAVAIFSLAVFTSIVTPIRGAAGSAAMMAAVGGALLLFGFGGWLARANARQRQPKRRRHKSQPKPPWAHPLARTERTNMFAEALADEFSVVVVTALAGLSGLLWSPLPLLVAGGLQLMWLALIPDTKWFRARVERKQAAMAQEQSVEVREEQIEFLADDQKKLHQQVLDSAERARNALQASNFPLDSSKLDRVVDHHLWLMQLENYYADLDDHSKLRGLDKQISAAESDLEGMDGRMHDVLETRLEILRRRHVQLARLGQSLQEVSDKRRMLEETLMLVAESALSSTATNPLDEIDEVLLDLETAEEVVLDLHDEDEALEREIEKALAEAPITSA
jgi:hypothetical protein